MISGYQSGYSLPSGTLTINASTNDFSPGILGAVLQIFMVPEGSYVYSYQGDMALYNIARHEIAHLIGLGTLWSYSPFGDAGPIYNDVGDVDNGQYTGESCLAAYNTEFNQSGLFVPVEQGGGGTAGSHWNEIDGGVELTGVTDGFGNDMRDELMTGWMNPFSDAIFVSQTTIASFEDIGYVVVPLPSALLVFFSGLMGLWGLKRLRGI